MYWILKSYMDIFNITVEGDELDPEDEGYTF